MYQKLSALLHQHQSIGIDVDEVLAATFRWMLHLAHQHGYAEQWQSFEDMREYDFFLDPALGMTKDDSIWLWDLYWQQDAGPKNAALVPYAREGVQLLAQMQKELYAITARSSENQHKFRGTHEWMQRHFPQIERNQIFFANHFSSQEVPKSLLCQAHDITLMIDDSLQNAVDLTTHGITCILFERPWNRDKVYTHPLLVRIGGWHDIITALS